MNTTKTLIALMSFSAMGAFYACQKQSVNPASPSATPAANLTATGSSSSGGNGAPSGTHYELNIIGVPKGKTANITTGNRIFVPLYGSCKIMLNEGSTFNVLDANGTDGTASFQLPNPDPTNSGTTTYSVYTRAVAGKGSSTMTTCATDPTTGDVVCSNESVVSVKSTKFTNVSQQLLYIYADLNGDGVVERYPLFDDRLQDYFWQYDNNGLRNLQMRFYWVSTTVK